MPKINKEEIEKIALSEFALTRCYRSKNVSFANFS